MEIVEGLLDHMVLQRNGRGVCDVVVRGTCSIAARRIVVRVCNGTGRVVRGFAKLDCGAARRGRFTAHLRGLPAGGPYDIELQAHDAHDRPCDRAGARDVQVGDVWILGGQSNMQGCGRIEHRARPDPNVRAFYMDDRWRTALDPIHNLHAAVDPIHRELHGGVLPPPERVAGVGPGVAFGKEMFRRTGVPQGFLACAHGGTSMVQWNPALKKLGGGSLYGATVRRLRKNGGRIAGVVWYQGESDVYPDASPTYTRSMRELILALRRDSKDSGLPFALVQLSRVIGWSDDAVRPWNSIQDQQRRLPAIVPRVTTVPAVDLRLDDAIHIEGADQQRLGRRLAEAMDALRLGRIAGLPPIDVGRVSIERQRGRDMAIVVVDFKNVTGSLRSAGRASGFSIGGSPSQGVFDTRLARNRALLYVNAAPAALSSAALSYGAGTNPVCNVTDDAGRSLPVFGPIPLGRTRALSSFCRAFDVAYLPKSFDALGAEAPDGLRYKRWISPGDFADSRQIYPQWPSRESCLIYRVAFDCTEKMRLDLLLGYDGPVAAWIDGKRVARDAAGTNPCFADELSHPFTASLGLHELFIALGSQKARAWGLMVRLARCDVSRKQIETGQPVYAMPLWDDADASGVTRVQQRSRAQYFPRGNRNREGGLRA